MEKTEAKQPESRSNWRALTLVLALAAAAVFVLVHCNTAPGSMVSFTSGSADAVHDKGRVLSDGEYFPKVDLQGFKDKASGFRDKASEIKDTLSAQLGKRDESEPTPWYNVLAIRILLGIGVFAFLNIVVITIHHIVQKVSRSTSSYKEVQHDYSPF